MKVRVSGYIDQLGSSGKYSWLLAAYGYDIQSITSYARRRDALRAARRVAGRLNVDVIEWQLEEPDGSAKVVT